MLTGTMFSTKRLSLYAQLIDLYGDFLYIPVSCLQIKPPYIPSIKDAQDTSYFDREFTEQPAQLTPPGVGGNCFIHPMTDTPEPGGAYARLRKGGCKR
jgi:hypothetical protein